MPDPDRSAAMPWRAQFCAGTSKHAALRAILRTGLVNRLVVDGDLASRMTLDKPLAP